MAQHKSGSLFHRALRALSAGWILICLGTFATAETMPKVPAAQVPLWQAIGIVNLNGRTSNTPCTGSLIAADLVLTASHCVRKNRGTWHFVLPANGVRPTISRRVSQINIHPAKSRAKGLAAFDVDVALLRLAQPVSAQHAQPLSLAQAGASGNSSYRIVGYHQHNPSALHSWPGCRRINWGQGRQHMVLNCRVVRGNSGAPALIKTATGWQIAAVITARLDSRRWKHAIAAPIDSWVRRNSP